MQSKEQEGQRGDRQVDRSSKLAPGEEDAAGKWNLSGGPVYTRTHHAVNLR